MSEIVRQNGESRFNYHVQCILQNNYLLYIFLPSPQEWAASVKNVCEWANNPWSAPGSHLIDQSILKPVNVGWGAFCHSAMAMYDANTQTQAAEFVKGLESNQLVGGTGIASTLLFIYGQT